MAFDIEMIKKAYGTMAERVDKARELVGRPLTLSEKIFIFSPFGKVIRPKLSQEEKIMLISLQIG